MLAEVTSGIKVEVETRFEPSVSDYNQRKYYFSYHITIRNNNPYTVQLLFRHWDIFDSSGFKYSVEGEGVIGLQPEIEPNGVFSYSSGCKLNSAIGKMSGYYKFIRLLDENTFNVAIPSFELVVPHLLN